MTAPVEVVAAVVLDGERVLVTRRPSGTHLAGLWEFPGGKVEAGEDHASALRRELHEEVGLEVEVLALRLSITHEYPEKTVRLHFYDCRSLGGTATAIEVAEVRWCPIDELDALHLPAADRPLVASLRATRR